MILWMLMCPWIRRKHPAGSNSSGMPCRHLVMGNKGCGGTEMWRFLIKQRRRCVHHFCLHFRFHCQCCLKGRQHSIERGAFWSRAPSFWNQDGEMGQTGKAGETNHLVLGIIAIASVGWAIGSSTVLFQLGCCKLQVQPDRKINARQSIGSKRSPLTKMEMVVD